ncbi:MAG: phage protein Gp36 family protein, partial [Nitrososphaeraceae archaeon]|nr:phage protein Gp36 family protein [Nitrososphaeraceae archaeon]
MSLKLISGYAIGNKVTLVWHPQFKTDNPPISSVFSINYGGIDVNSYNIIDNRKIILTLSRSVNPDESIIFSYTPPNDSSDLTAPTPPGASVAILESAKADAITGFIIDNLTPEVEDKTDYNLAPNYPIPDNGTPNSAVVDDFIATYGYQEALQLSNLNNAAATVINERRIERAIEDALALIDAYVKQAPKANKLLVSSSRRRTAMIIARFYLDSVRRRKDVTEDYDRAIKELDLASDPTRGGIDLSDPALAINQGGLCRAHVVPQRYNAETGKGFAGFQGDSAYDYPPNHRLRSED